MLAALLGGLSAAAGSYVGNKMMGEGPNPWQLSDTQNGILQRALNKSIQALNDYNKLAETTLQTNYLQSRRDISQGEKRARQQAYVGYDLARSLSTPYRTAGLNAFDKYQSTLGLPIPKIGSSAVSDALYKQQRMQQIAADLTGNPYAISVNNPGLRPNYNPQTMISNNEIDQYITQNLQRAGASGQKVNRAGTALFNIGPYSDLYASKASPEQVSSLSQEQINRNAYLNPTIREYARNQLWSSSPYAKQLQDYQNSVNLFNQYNSIAANMGYTPEQQQIANQYRGLFNG